MADTGERPSFDNFKAKMSSVLETLNEFRETARFCDVILRVSGEDIHAHSNVLAAASPYFGSLLEQGQDAPRAFSQRSPQIIKINIDGADKNVCGGYRTAVQNVVEFMYTAKIDLSMSILSQVIEIAKIMKMKDVLSICDSFRDQNERKNTTLTEDYEAAPNESDTDGTNDLSLQSSCQLSNQDVVEKPLKQEINDYLKSVSEKKWPISTEADEKEKPSTAVTDTGYLIENDDDDNDGIADEVIDNHTDIPRVDQGNKTKKSSPRKPYKQKKTPASSHVIDPVDIIGSDGPRRSKRQVSNKHLPDDSIYNTLFPGPDKEMPDDCKQEENNSEKCLTYTCDECDFTTDKAKCISVHKRDHLHSNHICSFCYLQHDSAEDLASHLPVHSGPQRYFCTICETSFKTRTQLNMHLPKHSTEKPFMCDICNAGFKWKHALKSHMVVHSGSKDHLCDICGFSTAHKSQLKAHKLVHTGDTFKCDVEGCSFQATKKQNLKYHMLTHTREKPHQCYVCGQSFSLSKNMKRHMLLHEEGKTLQCELCPFTTKRHDKLKEHGRKQHGTGEAPSKKRRIADYNLSTVPVTSESEISTLSQETCFIQVKLPSDVADTSLLPVTLSQEGGENITVQYYCF